jgi:hypothetical protein
MRAAAASCLSQGCASLKRCKLTNGLLVVHHKLCEWFVQEYADFLKAVETDAAAAAQQVAAEEEEEAAGRLDREDFEQL